jgi:hypothetical protein
MLRPAPGRQLWEVGWKIVATVAVRSVRRDAAAALAARGATGECSATGSVGAAAVTTRRGLRLVR